MTSIAVLTFAGALAWIGRAVFGRWFNHVTIYSGVWGVTLSLFELRYIEYYSLSTETWVLIVGAWLSFSFGSLLTARRDVPGPGHDADVRRPVAALIIGLSLLALISVIDHLAVLLGRFGSVENILLYGNVIYSLRLSGDLGVDIPYLDSMAIAGCLFGGLYHAASGKLRPLALLPLLVVIIESISSMGRAKLLIALVLYLSGYLLSRHRTVLQRGWRESGRLRRWIGFAAAPLLVLIAAEAVRSNRGAIETFEGASRQLASTRGWTFITPSIYLYFSVHFGVFDQYLKDDPRDEISGTYTFAPVHRLLAKAGWGETIPDFDKFYRTPAAANTGTYLHQIHHDFGIPGVFVAPFVLGAVCTALRKRFLRSGGLFALAALGHLYALVGLSYFVSANRLGYWTVSLLVSLALGWYLDGRRRARAVTPPEAAPA